MDEVLKELILNMQSGDEAAFDRLYHTYARKLYRTAYLISGSKEDSEDILQETFVKCFLHCHEIKSPEFFETWLMKIMVRTSWRIVRQRKSNVSSEELLQKEQYAALAQAVFMDRQTPGPLEQIMEKEVQAMLMTLVNGLDVKLKTVIVLYYYHELPVKEIAELTGSLEGTVKSRLHTARTRLKKQLEKNVDLKREKRRGTDEQTA